MEEFIQKWREFMIEWKKRDGIVRRIDENIAYLKPDLHDFMEWLASRPDTISQE